MRRRAAIARRGAGSSLTEAQQLAAVAAEWHAIHRSTERADRAAAEAALARLYRTFGWRAPRRIMWYESPAAAAPAVVAMRAPALFAPGVESLAAPAVGRAFRPEQWRMLRGAFSRAPRDHVKRLVDGGLHERTTRTPVLDRAGCGQHDARWVGLFDAGRRVFGVEPPRALDAWIALSRACGWWWAFRDEAVACDRQTAIRYDAAERLSATDAPALAFADGFRVYAIGGVRLDGRLIEDFDRIDAATISAQRNSEVRRVLIDRYGMARYLEESRAETVGCDRYGTLYRLAIEDDEPFAVVKVRNATPEPDGTWKDYFLRVPPDVRTAHEAVAWTFGMQAAAYVPTVET